MNSKGCYLSCLECRSLHDPKGCRRFREKLSRLFGYPFITPILYQPCSSELGQLLIDQFLGDIDERREQLLLAHYRELAAQERAEFPKILAKVEEFIGHKLGDPGPSDEKCALVLLGLVTAQNVDFDYLD